MDVEVVRFDALGAAVGAGGLLVTPLVVVVVVVVVVIFVFVVDDGVASVAAEPLLGNFCSVGGLFFASVDVVVLRTAVDSPLSLLSLRCDALRINVDVVVVEGVVVVVGTAGNCFPLDVVVVVVVAVDGVVIVVFATVVAARFDPPLTGNGGATSS